MATKTDSKKIYEKLGITGDDYAVVVNPPANYFEQLAMSDYSSMELPGLSNRRFDFIHLFITDQSELKEWLHLAVYAVAPWGMIWVSWQKQASPNHKGLTEEHIRKAALPLGIVDVKVLSFDKDWSALKLVFRKK